MKYDVSSLGSPANYEHGEKKKKSEAVYILMTLMSSNPLEQAVPFMKVIIFLNCLSASLDYKLADGCAVPFLADFKDLPG